VCVWLIAASVTDIQWLDENGYFAIGYSDGVIVLGSRDASLQQITLEAHEVRDCSVYKSNFVLTRHGYRYNGTKK
jgi:hypothetical protein